MAPDLAAIIRRAPTLVVRLALEHVVSASGAREIYRVESHGLCRTEVMRTAERRIAELEGHQQKVMLRLVTKGEAIEKPTPRIVEAVGRAKRHPGW